MGRVNLRRVGGNTGFIFAGKEDRGINQRCVNCQSLDYRAALVQNAIETQIEISAATNDDEKFQYARHTKESGLRLVDEIGFTEIVGLVRRGARQGWSNVTNAPKDI